MFTSPYTHTRERSAKFATLNVDESLTQQSDKDDCDINIIMTKYGITGQVPGTLKPALYGDFSEVGDFHEAQRQVLAAREAFMEVPAHIRKEFNNDPGAFMAFVQNPDNLPKLREWKLANELPITDTTTRDTTGAPAPSTSTTGGTSNG